MKLWIMLTLSTSACLGCTSLSLQRNTLSQAATSQEIRYQEVLDNLAMIAHEPSSLPVYASIYAGTTQITDSGSLNSTTSWQRQVGAGAQNGFGSEALTPSASRMISDNWALDPVAVPEKLEAMRAACKCAVFGLDTLSAEENSILDDPDHDPSPGRHFGVRDRLTKLKPCWLRVGKLKDVPLHAAYKAHYDNTWVWVLRDDTDALAEFALVFQDIARVSSNSLTLFFIPPDVSTFSIWTLTGSLPDGHSASVSATVSVLPGLHLCADTPYYRWRQDNRGAAPASITSKLSAASLTP
jgi:hypothetical protein